MCSLDIVVAMVTVAMAPPSGCYGNQYPIRVGGGGVIKSCYSNFDSHDKCVDSFLTWLPMATAFPGLVAMVVVMARTNSV